MHLTSEPLIVVAGVMDARECVAQRNGRLREAVGLLDRQVQQVRRRSERAVGRVEVAAAEHRAIVDAVVSEDPDTAERAMREHLANARDAALSLLLPATG